jgi:hypothetical protein
MKLIVCLHSGMMSTDLATQRLTQDAVEDSQKEKKKEKLIEELPVTSGTIKSDKRVTFADKMDTRTRDKSNGKKCKVRETDIDELD